MAWTRDEGGYVCTHKLLSTVKRSTTLQGHRVHAGGDKESSSRIQWQIYLRLPFHQGKTQGRLQQKEVGEK